MSREMKDDVTLPMSSTLAHQRSHSAAGSASQFLDETGDKRVVTSNLTDRTLTLIQTLQSTFLPPSAHSQAQSHSPGASGQPQRFQHLHHASRSSDDAKDNSRSSSPPPNRHHYGPLVSGWLVMQKNPGKWKKMWCEFVDGQLTYRTEETNRKPNGSILVTFIEIENHTPTRPPNLPLPISPARQTSNGGDDGTTLPVSPGLTSSVSSPMALHMMTRQQSGQQSQSRPPLSITTNSNTVTNLNNYNQPLSSNYNPQTPKRPDGNDSQQQLVDLMNRTALTPQPAQAQSLIVSPVQSQSQSQPAASSLSLSLSSIPINIAKQDEAYYGYLDTLETPYFFKLYAPTRVYYFRAESVEQRSHFYSAIRSYLLSAAMENQGYFTRKQMSSQSLTPILHEQFLLQLNRYNQLMKALQKMTMEDELPITSTRKEKSGVLMMETVTDSSVKWRDYYFVLFEGALFYYKDSKSTTPTGFMTLKFASISIDVNAMINNDYVFHVVTPLRTIACKTKHAVALTEWIAALESALLAHVRAGKGDGKSDGKRERIPSFGGIERSVSSGGNPTTNMQAAMLERERSSSDNDNRQRLSAGGDARASTGAASVMQTINRYIAEVQNLTALVNHAVGHERFRNWLTETRDASATRPLDFFLVSNSYTALHASLSQARESEANAANNATNAAAAQPRPETQSLINQCRDAADSIYGRFLSVSAADYIGSLGPQDTLKHIDASLLLAPPPASVFDSVRRPVLQILTSHMREFKRSPAYVALSSELEQAGEGSDVLHTNANNTVTNREVPIFDAAAIQSFTLRVKDTKKSREIKFAKKENLLTIGRDKSNKLVIEDSRVSRSHARVEYSDTQCEYIDLGSSCGSKLNGKPVLRAKLKSGDVLELGQSTIIFQVKQRRKSSFGIGTFFGSDKNT